MTSVDLSTKQLLVLPKDLARFGIDIDHYPIAKAVRMSIGIPLFYEQIVLKDTKGQSHYMVDGGLLSNYPIWILDDGTTLSNQPTFGFKIINKEACATSCVQPTNNLLEYLKLLVSTLLDAADHIPITNTKKDRSRSIFIPSQIMLHGEEKTISTTDFSISQQESAALFENGIHAAEQFLAHWNFSRWQSTYRKEV